MGTSATPLFTKVKDNVVRVDSFSGGGQYYITAHPCPHCEDLLWVCSCPSFQMGIARMGKNPFAIPCKHIDSFVQQEFKTHVEILIHFGKAVKTRCKGCGKAIYTKLPKKGIVPSHCGSSCRVKAFRKRKKKKLS